MSDDEPVTIRSYGSPQDAFLAKNVLADEGIPASVTDDNVTTWLWHIGTALGGTRLHVARRDALRAAEVLRATESHSGAIDGATWKCPHCGAEVDAGFDVCWSCEVAREEQGVATSAGMTLQQREKLADADQEEGESDEYDVTSPADADAVRAWRAAMFGLFVPPLLLYSLYLTVKIMNRELSPPATRRFYAALGVSLICTAAWTLLFRLAE